MGDNDCSCGDGGWTPDSQIDDYRDGTPLDEKMDVAGALISAICKDEEYEQTVFTLAAEHSIRSSGSTNFEEWIDGFTEKIRIIATDVWDYCKNRGIFPSFSFSIVFDKSSIIFYYKSRKVR